MKERAGKFSMKKLAWLCAFKKIAKSLGDGMERPAAMKDLVKTPFELQPTDRHFDDAAFVEFMANRDARQDRKAVARHQGFLHRFCAAELHGDVQKLMARLFALGEQLPFADESFEVVICRVALPYMDNHKALTEIARVLRPQGKFLLKIHAPLFYWGMLKERAKTLNPKQLAYPVICLIGGTINRLSGKHPPGNFWKGKEVYQTRKSLAKELEKRGMKIIRELPDTNDGTPSFLIERK